MAVLAPLAVLFLLGAACLLALAVRRSGWPALAAEGPAPTGRLAILCGVVALPVAALAFFTSTSGFVWDDLKNFRQAQVEGLTLEHLLSPTSGHFAPGHRLGDSLLQDVFRMNWTVAQVLLLGGFALSLLLFHRILVELIRPGMAPLLLTLLYGISLTHVGVLQWWASGLDRMPATLATFVSILAYLRFFKTGSRPLLALSVGALAAGLLFYVKPVFVPLYLVLLRILLLDPDVPVSEGLRAVVGEWKVWALYAAPVLVFSLVYVATYPTGLNEPASVPGFFSYLFNLWFRVFVPNLFGVFVPKQEPTALAIGGAVAAHAAVVALVAWSVARRPGAWRAWAFFAAGFAANAVIVGLTRVGFFTPKFIAYTLYYNLESTYLFYVAVGAAFFGRGSDWEKKKVRAPVQAGTAAGLVVSLAFAGWGAAQLSSAELWVGRRARTYLDRAAAGLARLQRSGHAAALVDGVSPYSVVPYMLVPYNSHSELLPLLDGDVRFDATGNRELFRVMRDGAVRPVSFERVAGGGVFELLVAQSLAVSPPHLDLGDRGLCVAARSEETVVGYTPPQPLRGEPWYLSVSYGSTPRKMLALAAEPIGGGEPLRTRLVTLPGRPDVTTVFALDAVELQRVYLVLEPGGELCIKTLEVGRLIGR